MEYCTVTGDPDLLLENEGEKNGDYARLGGLKRWALGDISPTYAKKVDRLTQTELETGTPWWELMETALGVRHYNKPGSAVTGMTTAVWSIEA